MTDPFGDLDELREGWEFEAKLAGGRDGSGGVPASFWDTYSAMANSDGGYVALGVREHRADGRLEVVGVSDPDRVELTLFNDLNNREIVSANVVERGDVRRVTVDGRVAIVVHVARAPRDLRPVYLGRDPFSQKKHRGTYIRLHEGDRHVPEARVRRMFVDAHATADSEVLEQFGLDDLHLESVRRYRNLFASHRPEHPFLTEDDAGFLRSIRATARDRARDVDGPTFAGLLMLGKESAIRDLVPHFHLSYREEDASVAEGVRWTDRVHPDGTWNANLFEFYLLVIRKLHAELKVPFALDPDMFRRDQTPVHEALREALVNALIHADYAGRSGVRIVRRASGFEMVNPGGLLVSVEQVWRGGVSEPRNPTLHHLFGLLKLGEREGSGGPRIRTAWREQHWRVPRLVDDRETGVTRLILDNESLLPPGALKTIERRFPKYYRELDEAGRVVLVTVLVEDRATHSRLVEATGLHSRDVTLLLQKLQRWGVVERAGQGRRAPYRLVSAAVSTEHSGVSSEHNGRSSEHNGPSSEHNGASSEHNGRSSEHSRAASGVAEWTDLPNVARVRRSRRAARLLVEAALVEATTGGFRTLPELAAALGRSADTLRVHYVGRMVADGRLESRFDSATDPRQAYRACKQDQGPD